MGRDLPDGTRKMVLEFSGGLVGLEELAARLGSIVPWNMQGNVFLQEDFEGTLVNWTTETAGVGSVVALTTTYYRSSAQSLNLKAANLAGAYARAKRYLPHLGSKKYGFACALTLDALSEDTEFLATFKLRDIYTYSGIKISKPAKMVYAKTGAGVWTPVYDLPGQKEITGLFNLLEFTVDLVNGVYGKLRFNDTETNLGAFALSSVDNLTDESYIMLEVAVNAVAGVGGTIYVDDIVAVRNVP